jgi:hypothetical protein
MRQVTHDPLFDRSTWQTALLAASGSQTRLTGVCGQDTEPQSEIQKGETLSAARMHCVEALPVTAPALKTAALASDLGKHGFHIVHSALSRQDGTTRFPKQAFPIGSEHLRIFHCDKMNASAARDGCEEVSMHLLDNFADMHVQDGTIHFLSIVVEGNDYDALMEGCNTLKHVKCLEFECHLVSPWDKHPLSSAVDPLNWLDFTSYRAGEDKLWRITGCYRPQHDKHIWSNVACMNRVLAPKLAEQMERVFLETIGFAKVT